MNKNYFEILRAGINSTFQDLGRNNLYHIGVPFSGAMDNRNYLLANKLVGNDHNDPVIEFASGTSFEILWRQIKYYHNW